MSKKRNQITYIKPDPPFLQRIRQQVGYQAEPDVETKRQLLGQADEKDLEDQIDEKPVVVITKNSNLTKEEQEDFAEKLAEVKPARILFKKPVKKEDEAQAEEVTTSRQPVNDRRSNAQSKRPFVEEKKSDTEDNLKKVKTRGKNSRLLSFDDDGEF